MSDNSFVHLHVHTEYSILDGAAKYREALLRAKELGQPALAMTDHGNLFGAYHFCEAAEEIGVKPIIGIEVYIAPTEKEIKKTQPIRGYGDPEKYTHMTLLAENNTGLKNLFKITAESSIYGTFWGKPRADRELINKYSEGIIGTSGCMGGEVKQLLNMGQYEAAKQSAKDWSEIFGHDNYFIELMDHGIEAEQRITPELIQIARELDLPLVATNDAHYTHEEDSNAQDLLLCIQTGSQVDSENRFKFEGGGYHLTSSEYMRELYSEYPEACDNTLRIAERCNAKFEHRDDIVPRFPVPEGETESSWLRKATFKGLEKRYPDGVPDKAIERAEYELQVIDTMQYPGYFLVVADFINYGKSKGILFGDRGSAAGSIVSYAMRITNLDPIRHGLMFERFLNPERVSPPDVDVDIQDDRREEVIQYVIDKYGDDRVAHIITYGTLKGKSAIKSTARALGYPVALGKKLSDAYPEDQQGNDAPLSAITDPEHNRYKDAETLRKMYHDQSDVKHIIDRAFGIEGVIQQWGTHAAGIVMCDIPLDEVIPMIVNTKSKSQELVTQFDMGVCEDLGLLKMDFLGLRNLTIVSNALDMVKQNHGVDIDLETLALDDKPTYDLLARGESLGVFQLDGKGMRDLLCRVRPTTFEDITATISLYRPGPMGVDGHVKYADRKNDRAPVEYMHPELAEALQPTLEETYGLIVYQEQVMEISQKLAGYSLAEADLLRRAMGKKKKSEMDKQKPLFLQGMLDRGFSEEAFNTTWETLVPFSDYAFNRAHAAAYGIVAYWTAYLKANYPTEYMSALLTASSNNTNQSAVYLSESRRMGLTVAPPDVNQSTSSYTPVKDKEILYGLLAIKGVGEGPVDSIYRAREKDGPFTGLSDFCYRAKIRSTAIKALIEAGALDTLGYTRKGMVEAVPKVLEVTNARGKDESKGMFDIFSLLESESGESIAEPDVSDEEWSKDELLGNEYALTGVYLSGHPLEGYMRYIDTHSTYQWSEIPALKQDTKLVTGGLLGNVQHRISKKGNPWMLANLISVDGVIEVICFNGKILEGKKEIFQDGNIVMVKTHLDKDVENGSVKLIIDDIKPVTTRDEDMKESLSVKLKVPEKKLTKSAAQSVTTLITNHRGTSEFSITIAENGKVISFKQGVDQNPQFKRELIKLFGRNCIVSGFDE